MPQKVVGVLLTSKEQTDQLFLHGELKDELKQLRRDMSMQNGQEILLSITIADDDMTRHVHMFPEVFFMDVIANTNHQKRDLFLMVVKDASGEISLAVTRSFHAANSGYLLKCVAIFLSVIQADDTVLPTPCTHGR